MSYTAWSVVFGEQPTAAKWNILGANDASFNDGTGFGASVIATSSLVDKGGITPVGGIINYWSSGGAAPTGWMYCDGSTVSDAGSVLNGLVLPNIMNAKFVRGVNNTDIRTTPNNGGADSHTHSVPAHAHTMFTTGPSNAGDWFRGDTGTQFTTGSQDTNTGPDSDLSIIGASPGTSATVRTATDGSSTSGSTSNVPLYIGLTFIIRIK